MTNNGAVSKILSFALTIVPEIWIFLEALQLYTLRPSSYNEQDLFWFFILIMIAPVLPQITFYTKNKSGSAILHALVILILFLLIVTEPSFVPSLPFFEVTGILLYAYVTIGINYLLNKNNLIEHTKTEVAYSTFRIIAFFVAVFSGSYFGNPESFSDNYLLFVMIAIPLYLIFAVSIFVNFELKTKTTPPQISFS